MASFLVMPISIDAISISRTAFISIQTISQVSCHLRHRASLATSLENMTVGRDDDRKSDPTYDGHSEILDNPSSVQTGRRTKRVVTFVTGNKKKLEEVKQILASGDELPFEVVNKKIDLPELQGDAFEIAKEKCKLASLEVKGPVFTEDTSLCFNALNGMPGPYIKWFLEKCGHDGLNKMLDGFDDRTGYAQTIVAYTEGPTEEVHLFEGRTNGTIVRPRGSLDFGWDPIFEPNEGEGKTYAEMSKDAKNAISHRGRSFAKVRDFLLKQS